MPSLTQKEINYSKWYNEIVIKSDLAENSGVRGCMIIKPYGLSIWENIKLILDKILKNTGHKNIYFPLLIPKSYFVKESKHLKEFSKECAVVTHYRMINTPDNKNIIIDSKSKLKEELIIRPTSEAIIWNSYKKWIKSYRDLPLLFNQWTNVIRWEMRTRFFLRTSEFLWQEGHTAHSSKKEALKETKKILNIYKNFLENFMAIPVIKGIKSESERFAGADETYCIEAIMQDGKSLQIATSHFLGQNFSKVFDVKFIDNKKKEYVWSTSWGISTRLIGALIMTHSDNNGLILPPKIAPIQVVIIPIFKKKEQKKIIEKYSLKIKSSLEESNITVMYDNRENKTAGWKFNEYEIKGIPIRITIGIKDIENNNVEIFRRDNMKKYFIPKNIVKNKILNFLESIQKNIYEKALFRKNKWITVIENYKQFKKILNEKGGFLLAHWDGTIDTEKKIKEETMATIRCIPINLLKKEKGKCIYSGKESKQRVLFAKSY